MKFAKVMFLQVSVCPQRGHAWQGGMHGMRGMHGRGCAWCGGVWWGGMHGGGHGGGGVHGRGRGMHGGGGGTCMVGVCMVGGMHGRGVCAWWGHAWQGGMSGRYYGYGIRSMSRRYASY